MKIKIYGKLIESCQKGVGDTALLNRVLEIYETKRGLKGVLWAANTIGWRETRDNVITVVHFGKTDKEHVKEYFNFD